MNYAKYGLAGLMMQHNENSLKNREMDLREKEIDNRNKNQKNILKVRLQRLLNQSEAQKDRVNLGNAQLAERQKEFIQQLAEKRREFDEKFKSGFFKNRQLGGSLGNGALPIGYKYAMNALQTAEAAGALNPDGTIDMSKLNPSQSLLVKIGLLGAARQVSAPSALRQTVLSPNVLATMDKIEPDVLAYYAGSEGKKRFAIDSLKSFSGANVPMLNKYKSQMAIIKEILPAQITQAYQGSVQPKAIESLTNALYSTDWTSNPESVRMKLNNMRELLEREYKNSQNQTGGMQDVMTASDNTEINLEPSSRARKGKEIYMSYLTN